MNSIKLDVQLALSCCDFLCGDCNVVAEDLAEKQVELKKGDRIIFFGDSLTALAGQEAPKEHVTKGYVRIVRETLRAKHTDKKIEVDWVATGGHTVPDLLKRVDKDVIAKKPTIVVIQIGCNDARRIPKETFQDEPGGTDRQAAEGGHPSGAVLAHQRRREARRHEQGRPEARGVRRGRARGGEGEEGAAQRPAQGVRRPLEEEQSRQQAQRHPDLRRQPLQPDRARVRRRADAEEVQVKCVARESFACDCLCLACGMLVGAAAVPSRRAADTGPETETRSRR